VTASPHLGLVRSTTDCRNRRGRVRGDRAAPHVTLGCQLSLLLVAAVLAAGGCSSPKLSAAPLEASSLPTLAPLASPTEPPVQLGGSAYVATPANHTGGSVVVAEKQYPHTVVPYYAQTPADLEVAATMFDGLLRVAPDLRYAPDLATNIPTIDNGGVTLVGAGMDVKFTLKAGMKWSDGQPISCDDVKATWQWNADPANKTLPPVVGALGWQDIAGVDGGNSTTCIVHYSRVYEGYLGLFSAVLPAHYITTVAVKEAPAKLYPMNALGTGVYSGPFIPVSAAPPTQITLKANPNWATIGGHAPWLSSVTWKFYRDAAAMAAGFKAGQTDLGQDLGNLDLPSLSGIDASQRVIHDSLTYEAMVFNNASLKGKFGADYSIIVEAIQLATDRRAIAAGPLGGNVTLSNNFVSPLAWYYKTVDGSTAADPATASTLLANARWSKNADGYLSKAGNLLELTYCTDTRQVRSDTLQLVAAQLKSIGIKVDVVTGPATSLLGSWAATKADTPCNLRHGNFDVAEIALVSPAIDPLPGCLLYRSDQIPDNPPNTGSNVTRASLPALDDAYGTIGASVDFRQVRDAMFAIQDIYSSDKNTYELPLYFDKDVWLVSPRLHNLEANPAPGGAEWNAGDWWVD
jgi:peptide/nickel transport system substrate-binding protein